MDCIKTGKIIKTLRIEKGFTQNELANILFVSAKAVSKWETGRGFPDISVLPILADTLGVNIQAILHPEQNTNEKDNGSMKNLVFYVCPNCGNIITSATDAEISCCNKKVNALIAKKPDEEHILKTEKIEDEIYFTSSHPMEKQHYISFAALVHQGKLTMYNCYPEWNFELRLPARVHGKLYYYCTQHGLCYVLI